MNKESEEKKLQKLIKGAERNGILAFTNVLLKKTMGNIRSLSFEDVDKESEKLVAKLDRGEKI